MTSSDRLPNRWLIAVAAVCMQLCLGAAYGWSVFKKPLMGLEHWSETSVQLNFSLTFIFFAFGTIIGGKWQDRVGPRIVATTAGVLFGLGYLVSGYGTTHHNLTIIYLGYGLLAGLGGGMGYICPIATLVKWFPDRRGMMTGVAVCGYGFATMIMSLFAAREIAHSGVPMTFEILGIVYLIVVCSAAQFLRIPPQGWHPEGWAPRTAVAKAAGTRHYTLSEAAGTWQFYLLFLLTLMDLSAGYMFISQASPIAQELVGMTALKAAALVALISVFNGLGRVTWATVSDYIGRARAFFLIFLFEALVFFVLMRTHDWTLFTIGYAVTGFCYGGGLGVMPSFVADYFGATSVGAIYGAILAGGNLLGAISPIVIAHVHQSLGRYAPALNVLIIALLCSLILPIIARPPGETAAKTPLAASTD